MTTLKEHYSTSPEETLELGKSIGMQSAPNDIILLSGPIGAGKTCLAQGIASGLGFMEYVHSPTFVLIHKYQGNLVMYHMDLYRIDDPLEVIDLGLDEYFSSDSVCVIEWANKYGHLLPQEHLAVDIHISGTDSRIITTRANGDRYRKLIAAIS